MLQSEPCLLLKLLEPLTDIARPESDLDEAVQLFDLPQDGVVAAAGATKWVLLELLAEDIPGAPSMVLCVCHWLGYKACACKT